MFNPTKLDGSLFTAPEPVERVFTPDLKGFAAWLETMPPNAEYNYWDCNGACLIDQFCKISGMQFYTPAEDRGDGLQYYGSVKGADQRFGMVACVEPRTFGAALSRARRALTEAK